MANSPKRVYWDACTWIALIQKEKIFAPNGRLTENRLAMCLSVIAQAKKGNIEIVTSTLSLAEVCKNPEVKGGDEDNLADYFENDYILLANVDRLIGERARTLMMAGHAKLKPPDAIHIATAAIANVEEMHTFDGGLIDLDGIVGKLDGTILKICKPEVPGKPLPLLQGLAHERPKTPPPSE